MFSGMIIWFCISNWVLFPRESYFSYFQHPLADYSFLSRVAYYSTGDKQIMIYQNK